MIALLLVGAAATLVVDQGSKHLVARRGVRLVHNQRGALIALPPRRAAVVLLVAVGAALLLATQFGATTAVGLGLLVGGAAGNLVDRVRVGAVVDFVAIGWWPVFNLADAAIVVGIAAALVGAM